MADQNNKDEELENEEPEEEESEDEEAEDEEAEDESEEEAEDEESEEESESNSNIPHGHKSHARSKKKAVKKSAKTKTAVKAKPLPGVDLNAKVDQLTDKNTVITIAGYSFTPAKLMIAGTLLSSLLGGLYGSFEVYKDYMDMKKKIAMYVAPDMSELYKKMEVLETSTNKSVEYTQDIKNDLKGDIRRIEGVVEQVERSSKSSQRDVESEIKSVRGDVRSTLDRNRDDMDKLKGTVDNRLDKLQRDTDNKIEKIQRDVDKKIQNALDNPLANK